jgi:HSP20 family molecular chaperone IbpA
VNNQLPKKQDHKPPRRRRRFGRLRGKIAAFIDRILGSGFEQMEFGMEPDRDYDLEIRNDEIVVTANVSGFAADEIDVERRDKMLTIRGVKRHSPGIFKNSESKRRTNGAFKHSLLLPEAAAGETLETKYRSGVVQVHVPRRHAAHSR